MRPCWMHNRHHEVEMSERALGVRMTGCAGIELIALVLGQRAGYISNPAPWDYAPGGILMETLGFEDGEYHRERNFCSRWSGIVYWWHTNSISRIIDDRKSINDEQISTGICFFCKMKTLHYISERNSGIMACRVQCHQKKGVL